MERCQPSTVRTRLRFLNGLFGVAVEEGWVQTNPFFELTKRVRGRTKKKEVVSLDEADKDWSKLPQHHQLLWHLLRWTGSHASEAAGLRWSDIDLSSGVIHFTSHETRPLKNDFRSRTIPIHKNLMPILEAAKIAGLWKIQVSSSPGLTTQEEHDGQKECIGQTSSELARRQLETGQQHASERRTSMSQLSADCSDIHRRLRQACVVQSRWKLLDEL